MTEILSQLSFEPVCRPSLFIPEKNLLIAMLERALLDYLGNQRLEREEAAEWLFQDLDNNDERFSFDWICMHLDLSPSDVRRSVTRMKQRGETAAGRWWGIRRRA